MTFKPAHKVVGDVGKPGQTVNKPNNTLNYYIQRKQDGKKLTFKEWVITQYFTHWEQKPNWDTVRYIIGDTVLLYMQKAWKAAQENK